MGAYLGGDYISNFNKYNKVYQVDLQLRSSDRNRPESLASLFVRSENGEMMPINQFVSLTKEYMPQSINSFNMSVPFGLAGSLLFAKLFGVENNIYMQIGMVMLVGLLSKTAILLTVPVLFVVFQKIQERVRKNKSIQ